ncbi:MAG: ATP-dependent RNA helicase HrpA, partial [Gammaproteobacteria bacterium]|nr:ATP-dependent RNA helicase HrpA [Gammaproteobacteria bacterium]
IIAGETGSGKTTQIPKMCLELGRGIEGQIGHTQPRRLAARSVASRLCEELSCEMGSAVGYKVRFNDQVKSDSYIKLMTDGVLLAEMQHDRYLNKYDTLIIDEAHERSLNIDFILGYLKELLPKRPDLKVIITSATIDPESFSKHFSGAPIIEVTGRTYPVEVRYRPLDELDTNHSELSDSRYDTEQINGIFAAVDELSREGRGDILLFMNGEREIRDTADALSKRKMGNTEILPLYARLSAAEQNKIFAPHHNRRIVLATNVAETSLTVPGIKYVIDTGTARISRYSYKSKVQRLPIEPISQASANQRKGRCGRTEAGICIRLYSEEDFNSRPEFTAPEILRTNLASVILQMLSLNLGDLENFPFLQRPDSRFINDGVRLLEELQAIRGNNRRSTKNSRGAARYQLTESGKKLSRIPLDPRLAKMVLSAANSNCLHEIIVIVAALSIQDPRERPNDFKQKSDESHNRFKDKDSDFVAYLNLWDYIISQQKGLSRSQFRKLCKSEFLNYMRVREWQDLVYQVEQSVSELGYKVKAKVLDDESEQATASHDDELDDIPTIQRDYQGIHQALLSGLLSHIGFKELKDEQGNKPQDKNAAGKRKQLPGYQGARNTRFHVFPGSHLFKTSAKWLMAAELVETSKLYARYAARIQPEWIEPLAQHLVSKSHSEPHWDKKQGAVFAFEKQTLFGLVIVPKRKVQFGKIDPVASRDIFIREALLQNRLGKTLAFLQHNAELIEDIQRLENKSRRRDLLVDEETLVEFYASVLPEHICSKADLLKWLKHNDDKPLYATRAHFILDESASLSNISYPDVWSQGNIKLPLDYDFEPGQEFADGVSVRIPLALLNQVEVQGFDWHIPAYRHELIMALIKSLPKQQRRNYVPAPNFADALLQRFNEKETDTSIAIIDAMADGLFRMTGNRVSADDFNKDNLPPHLKMNFRIVDEQDNKEVIVKQGFDLDVLKAELKGQVKKTIQAVAKTSIEQKDVTNWNFGDLPESFVRKQGSYQIKAYPALVKHGNKLDVELLDDEDSARIKHLEGVVELAFKALPSPIKYLQQKLPNKSKLVMYFNPFGKVDELINDCIRAVLFAEFSQDLPRTAELFDQKTEKLRGEINELVLATALKVEKILLIGHKISKQLKGKVSFDMIQAHGYVKAHLDSLIYKGFVSECGVERLDDIYRYIQALEKRLEKIKVDANKDRVNQIELDKVYDLYDKLAEKYGKGVSLPEPVREIYWMIEELRVSMFAQNLKTKYPISSKRIKQAIAEIDI